MQYMPGPGTRRKRRKWSKPVAVGAQAWQSTSCLWPLPISGTPEPSDHRKGQSGRRTKPHSLRGEALLGPQTGGQLWAYRGLHAHSTVGPSTLF